MLSIELKDEGLFSLMDEKFHIVRSLTRTARDAGRDIKEDLPRRFTVRGAWVQKGIRFDPARISEPEARVYSVDDYMHKQQYGERYDADGHVAIPWAARPSKKSRIPSGMLPKALRGKADVFKFDYSKNPKYKPYPLVGIFQRRFRGKYIMVLYLLKKRKLTRPLWQFDDQVERGVEKYFTRHFLEKDVDSGLEFKPAHEQRRYFFS